MSAPADQSAEPCSLTGYGAEKPDKDDPAAQVRELYREHSSSLIRQLTRRSGCGETARELMQETFVRLLRMPPDSLRHVEQPVAFLRRISMNLLRDSARAKALKERSSSTLAAANQGFVDQVAAIESRDLLRRLESAVAQLRPRTRDIFLAHRIEGLTYSEIAARSGLSVKTVEKEMSRAIAALSRLVERN